MIERIVHTQNGDEIHVSPMVKTVGRYYVTLAYAGSAPDATIELSELSLRELANVLVETLR